MMINPYHGVNWETDTKISSVSHSHTGILNVDTQEKIQTSFDNLVSGGVKHFAVSNYYPSSPRYPLSDYFIDVPNDAISCPNAEQHNFARYGAAFHINSLGSFFTAGSSGERIDDQWVPDQPVGVNGARIQTIFPQIFAQLKYSDGGGITINHPVWSGLSNDEVMEVLDFDQRVLGIEIFNQSCGDTGWALEMWDAILLTGRKCWGFCVPDHGNERTGTPWQGRNVLLVPEATEHECLKAYREGRFFSRVNNTSLTFSNIELNNNTFIVETENADNINIIIDGQKQVISGNSAEVSIPSGTIYVRAEAESEEDMIFSNPITLKDKAKDAFSSTMFLLMM